MKNIFSPIVFLRSFSNISLQLIATIVLTMDMFGQLFIALMFSAIASLLLCFINLRILKDLSLSELKYLAVLCLSIFFVSILTWIFICFYYDLDFVYGIVFLEKLISPISAVWVCVEAKRQKYIKIEIMVYTLYFLVGILNLIFLQSLEVFAGRMMIVHIGLGVSIFYFIRCKPTSTDKFFQNFSSLFSIRLFEIVMSFSAGWLAYNKLGIAELGVLNRIQALMGLVLNFLNQAYVRSMALKSRGFKFIIVDTTFISFIIVIIFMLISEYWIFLICIGMQLLLFLLIFPFYSLNRPMFAKIFDYKVLVGCMILFAGSMQLDMSQSLVVLSFLISSMPVIIGYITFRQGGSDGA